MTQGDSKPVLGVLYCPTCEQEEPAGELCPRDGTRLVRLAADHDPFVGRVLDGRFTIEAKLGAGGMGSVYRAHQHSVGRAVAIKVVNPGLVTDATATKRFLREAKLASRLSHPNVVQVLDFGQTSDGLFYLVMELVQGRTLHAALLEEKRLSLDRVVRIAGQICDALEGAHALPMMHRDLKPANIMLLSAGRDLVKVLDFGLAKSLAIDATVTTMTSAGALLGTPTFMPPEVANGQSYDERADLYSLGCILYLLVTGRPPFVTDSVPEMIALHGSATPDPVTNVPRSFAQVIERLLLKTPDERYPNAAAVRTALEQALAAARSPDAATDTFAVALPDIPSLVGHLADERPRELPLQPPARPSEETMTLKRAAIRGAALESLLAEHSAPIEASERASRPSVATSLSATPPTPTQVTRRRPVAMIALALAIAAVLAGGLAYVWTRGGHASALPRPDAAARDAPPPDAAASPPDAAAAAPAPDAAVPPPDAAPLARPRTLPHAVRIDAGVRGLDAPF